MAFEVALPEDKEQKEQAIGLMITKGESARHVPEVNWWLAHHYLQGARDFRNINYQHGTLDISYVNEAGVLQFRYDDIVSKFQSQVGRLLQIDLSPRVIKRSIGLEGMRKASIAQVALDSVMPLNKVEEMKIQLFPSLTKYGCVAVAVWSEGEEIGIEIVMPWEIVPIPPAPTEEKDVRGLIRVRTVPLDWVKKLSVTPGEKANIWTEIQTVTLPIGEVPTESGTQFSTTFSSVSIGQGSGGYPGPGEAGMKGGKADKERVETVKFAEVWTETSTGLLHEYNIWAGGKLLYTKKYDQAKIHMPIQVMNDIKTGQFWGRSFISTLIPMNTEMEHTVGRVFQNVQDIDTYGILLEPTTLGIPADIFRAKDGTKRIRYEPDYMLPDLKPEAMLPVKSGTLPAQILKVGAELSDKIANQPAELMAGAAPGRVDSQAGLGFLYEVSNTPLTPTASNVALGISNCYRAMLNVMAMKWDKSKIIEVSMLDDSLAGIVLDAATGTMNLAKNVIPHPDEVSVTVRAMYPKSKQQEKFELMKALEIQTIDMFEYRIEVRKRGLELPVGGEAEWQNYRRAMMENIMLFGDGETPGRIVFDEHDIHKIHLRVLQPFMAKPEFYQTSSAVRNAVKKHYNAHLMLLGTMPEQMPYPEEAAAEVEMMQKMPGQGAVGPGSEVTGT